MRKVGYLIDPDTGTSREVLVGMTDAEWTALLRLSKADQGSSRPWAGNPVKEGVLDYDLSSALERVFAYTDSLVAVQSVLDQMSFVKDALKHGKK